VREADYEFGAAFESPGFKFGYWETPSPSEQGVVDLPYFQTNETVSAFIEAAYRHDWVAADFDWRKWTQTQEANALRNDPEALARANPEQISRLLTVCIREDRFCEGALQASYESGLLVRILRRSATILREIEPKGLPTPANRPRRPRSNRNARFMLHSIVACF